VMDSNLDFQIDLDSDVKVESSGPKSPNPKSSGSRSASRKSKVLDSGPRLVDKPSDSDVKVPPSSKDSDIRAKTGGASQSPSDSDIRLQDLPSSRKKGPDANIITEEIDLDAEEARSATQPKPASKPKPGTRAVPNPPVLPTTSPFELSENDLHLDPPPSRLSAKGSKGGSKGSSKVVKPAKDDTDSSSDFELIPFDASKTPGDLGSGEIPLLSGDEEIGLGDMPTPNAGNSGINLAPRDSGISLESGGSDELEFELTLDSGATPKPTSSKAAKKQKSKVVEDDSSSEFELSLDDSPSDASDSEFELSLDDESSESVGLGSADNSDSEFELTLDDEGGLSVEEEDGKDIFEETNFDVPALEDESGSEAVAIEDDTDLEGSDFEISLDDDSGTGESSESQVVALDEDEEADDAAATIARPKMSKSKTKAKITPVEEEPELDLEDLEASGPRKKPKPDEEGEDEDAEEEEEDDVVSAAPAAPVEWGSLPAILLAPTVLVLFVVGLMGFELIQSMWGYHRPAKVGRPLIDAIARTFDDTLPKD